MAPTVSKAQQQISFIAIHLRPSFLSISNYKKLLQLLGRPNLFSVVLRISHKFHLKLVVHWPFQNRVYPALLLLPLLLLIARYHCVMLYLDSVLLISLTGNIKDICLGNVSFQVNIGCFLIY